MDLWDAMNKCVETVINTEEYVAKLRRDIQCSHTLVKRNNERQHKENTKEIYGNRWSQALKVGEDIMVKTRKEENLKGNTKDH